ncbi:DotG/IcmE/VirB10 family protein [Methylosinus sp. LW3]|uniref:DotG/IcmE/VirB10 family protein n=1 Tax=Methylosinus sp. LW3 TaxID=107635 RepID=UPI0004664609|nr:DotG/IcmE/VirB10 family protein [Methylosinus sp. LW3]
MSNLFSKISLLSQLREFNRGGRGGPARIVTIAAVGVSMTALLVGVSSITHPTPPESSVAKMPEVDPLPGGMHSNPAQDALLKRHAQVQADKALASGASYTPPLPAAAPLRLVDRREPEEGTVLEPPPEPAVVPIPEPAPIYVPPERPQEEAPRVEQIAASEPTSTNASGGANEEQFKQAVADLFKQWEGRPPRTDLVLAPATDVRDDLALGQGGRVEQRAASARSAPPAQPQQRAAENVLVPAGRGVYAHTVLSVNSDTGGPIVLQADTGPLAGDRMIGTFSKNQAVGALFGDTERLIVRINSVEHHGQTINVQGLVIAPDSMETAVATSVDQHYIERFALPTAAAFVAGLGQAIALSNSTIGYTPFGGMVQSYGKLDFRQQAGIAGGAAAAQIGQTLQQQTPKGATVFLAANAGVGVIFLSNVAAAPETVSVDPASLNTK